MLIGNIGFYFKWQLNNAPFFFSDSEYKSRIKLSVHCHANCWVENKLKKKEKENEMKESTQSQHSV